MMTITIDSDQLTILELLEYNLSRKDINYALSNGVIAVDKSAASSVTTAHEDTYPMQDLNILVSGDFYFHNFLSSKVKLTDLGRYILESIKGRETMG